MTKRLLKGDKLYVPHQEKERYTIMDTTVREGCIKVFCTQTISEQYLSCETILDAVAEGELLIKRPGQPPINAASQNSPELCAALGRALQVVNLIKRYQRQWGLSIREAYEKIKREKMSGGHDDVTLPSLQTVYRYFQAALKDLPLLRGAKNKGNRTPRYPVEVTDLICECLNSLYLKEGSPWTIRHLTNYVGKIAQERALISPKSHISRNYVMKVLGSEAVDPELSRLDPKLLKNLKSIAKNRICMSGLFERVEQDSLHIPFIAMTPFGASGDLYVTHAIDCFSGMPCGWHFYIGSPSASHGLRALQHLLYPKTKELAKYGLSLDINLSGTPHQLIFDNGPEANNDRMKTVTNIDIDPLYCRSREAFGKPFIERLNRALKESLEVLAGCTRMDGKDGKRDPIASGDSLMSFEELQKWIIRWYIEDWAHRPFKRHVRSDVMGPEKYGVTPHQRWKRMTEHFCYPLPLPPTIADWRKTIYEHHMKRLNRKTGISHDGFCYKGDELGYLIRKYGETLVKVYVDPDDFRQIFVDDGTDNPLVPLTEEFVQGSIPAYSFDSAKEHFKRVSIENPGQSVQDRFRDDLYATASVATMSQSPKPSKRDAKLKEKQALVQKVREVEAISAAMERPLAARTSQSAEWSAGGADFNFDDIATLPMVNKKTGGI